MNTLLTYDQQLELVRNGLATCSINGHLSTFKYAKKVMFEYLWNNNPTLLECRGHTYDNTTKELVVAAPRKTFNYLENGTWKDKPLSTPVVAFKKYNGFMACVSKHNGEIIVSTTGSTKSDFVGYAVEMLNQSFKNWKNTAGSRETFLYEIVHPSDPHIVQEKPGAYLLGIRNKNTGDYGPFISERNNRSQVYYEGTLKGILAIAELNTTEGFMVYDKDGNCCKLKTPYYTGKKKLMRMHNKQVEQMYNQPNQTAEKLPKMWLDVPDLIVKHFTKDHWLSMKEQQRGLFLEIYKRN